MIGFTIRRESHSYPYLYELLTKQVLKAIMERPAPTDGKILAIW